MKRLMKKASPEVGETVKLTDDPRYKRNSNYELSTLDGRDKPIVIMKGKVYYGDNNEVTHSELQDKALKDNDLTEDDYVDDLAYAYYVDNFLGTPAVFIFKSDNYAGQAGLIKIDNPSVNVYEVDNGTNVTRVASRLRNIKLQTIVKK